MISHPGVLLAAGLGVGIRQIPPVADVLHLQSLEIVASPWSFHAVIRVVLSADVVERVLSFPGRLLLDVDSCWLHGATGGGASVGPVVGSGPHKGIPESLEVTEYDETTSIPPSVGVLGEDKVSELTEGLRRIVVVPQLFLHEFLGKEKILKRQVGIIPGTDELSRRTESSHS